MPEASDVEVLLHPLLVYRLRDQDDVFLQKESQGRLPHGLSVLLPDLLQEGIVEESGPVRTFRLFLSAL